MSERDPAIVANIASFSRESVLARIRDVLVKVTGIPVERMAETCTLQHDLEMDSLERIEAAMLLEEEFGIALSDDEVDQACMGTLAGIGDYLISQRGIVA